MVIKGCQVTIFGMGDYIAFSNLTLLFFNNLQNAHSKNTRFKPIFQGRWDKKACDKNYHWGCTNLGWLMEIGEGGPIDVKGAIKLYTKACKLGDPDACKSAKGLSR